VNLIGEAPIWLVAMLAAALVAAAVEDVIRLRISNITVLAVIATALVGMAVEGMTVDIWQNFAVFGGVLVIGTFLFSAGIMGGGDVKLFAAVGLWTDLQRAPMVISSVLIAGGLLALVVLVPRLVARRSDGAAASERSKGVPYAVAIAIGALFAIALQHQLDARNRNPLEFQRLAALSTDGD